MGKFSQWLGKLLGQGSQPLGEGQRRLLTNCLVVGLVGLVMLLTFGLFQQEPSPRREEEVPSPPREEKLRGTEELERELSSLLSAIEGAGVVKVAITLEGSSRREYARKNKESLKVTKQDAGGRTIEESTVEEEPLLAKRDGLREEPVLEREVYPVVKGALIVAEGAGIWLWLKADPGSCDIFGR